MPVRRAHGKRSCAWDFIIRLQATVGCSRRCLARVTLGSSDRRSELAGNQIARQKGFFLKVAARIIKFFSILAIFIGSANDLRAAAPYYEGKTIRIIVGTSPGGGYDTYTRLIARHLGNHIPGAPSIIV